MSVTLKDLESDWKRDGEVADTYCSGWVAYYNNDHEIQLDGSFSIEELKVFIQFLENRS